MAAQLTREQLKPLYAQAASGYAKKIQMEVPFQKSLNGFFNDITKDIHEYIKKYGHPPDVKDYQPDLEKLINNQQIKAATAFSDSLRSVYGYPVNNDVIQVKLTANIKGYAAQRAHLSGHQVMKTSSDNIIKAYNQAHVDLALAGQPINNTNLAKYTTNNLKGGFNKQKITTTITETAAGAENGKSLEYDALDDFGAVLGEVSLAKAEQQKVWIAVLDDHTRNSHVEADGQVVNADEPFEVDSELLQIPTDDSLGASAGNICNCRCSCEFVIE